MRQHSVLVEDVVTQCGQVRDIVAEAAHLQLHAHLLISAREHILKLAQVQADALRLGKPKLPVEAEVRQSVFGDVAVQPLLRFQLEVRSLSGDSGNEAARQEAQNCAAHPEPTHEVDPAVGGIPDGGGRDRLDYPLGQSSVLIAAG